MTDHLTSADAKSDLLDGNCEVEDSFTDTSENSSNKTSEILSNVESCTDQDFVPADNYFHSIFGAETPDWTKTVIKTENDEESEHTKSYMEVNKNILIPEVNIKKEDVDSSSSSGSLIQTKQSMPPNTKFFLSPKAYEQYQALLSAKIKCPNCFFTTCNRGNLKQHMKKHDKPEGFVYSCDICDFKTKYKNSMKGHAARHENRRSGSCRRRK